MTEALTPEPVESAARKRGWLSFGFAPRFFLALGIGLIWLVPVWWSIRFLPLLLVWDALVLAAWCWDLSRLPAPAKLLARRLWTGPITLARSINAAIEIQQSGNWPLQVFATDELSPALYGVVPQFELVLPAAGKARHEYAIVPRKRGDATLGSLFLRYRSAFAFAERWAVAPLLQTVCVFPDITEANQQALYLIRSRQMDMQKRRRRQPGLGREFESLRDYRTGDDVRDICWSATARRHELVTRTFEAERMQTVWVVIDAGRLLRAEIARPDQPFRLSKLDYSVNAALSLAQVASQYGDRVAALAYGRTIQQAIGAGRGPGQVRLWINALAHVRAETTEANHALAARALLQKQTRRALVVWITDFAETPTVPDVVEYAAQIAKRHLVLFAAVSQPDLAVAAHQVPRTDREMYSGAAALALLQRREVLIRNLRQQGVLAMEVTAGKLTTHLVNEYLAIKDRGML
ncbi:MAG TPA: DUF58 domain-containing protein [Bryobacteraceae bacterium]|nr:DUF58 domain-containing protein [Bryobacteraceae bacterium]